MCHEWIDAEHMLSWLQLLGLVHLHHIFWLQFLHKLSTTQVNLKIIIQDTCMSEHLEASFGAFKTWVQKTSEFKQVSFFAWVSLPIFRGFPGVKITPDHFKGSEGSGIWEVMNRPVTLGVWTCGKCRLTVCGVSAKTVSFNDTTTTAEFIMPRGTENTNSKLIRFIHI